jgi:MinD-like ATPase involved in chromosome partitioning or flagellar assembly
MTPGDRGEPAASAPPSERGGGALVAVCGVCGGAGTSTVAYLLGRSAGRAGEGPVLVCDLGGIAGGLAECAGVESAVSLPALANAVAAGEELGDGLVAHGGDGLRVVARGPRFELPLDSEGMVRVLHEAREAHTLSLFDCGVPGSSCKEIVLAASTHVAWVLPATPSGARRARRLLGLFPSDPSRREIVVAREHPGGGRARTAELAELAADRRAPLVLMPQVPDLSERGPEAGLEAAALSLDAIRAALRR